MLNISRYQQRPHLRKSANETKGQIDDRISPSKLKAMVCLMKVSKRSQSDKETCHFPANENLILYKLPPNGRKENAVVQTSQPEISPYLRNNRQPSFKLPRSLSHAGQFASESLHTELELERDHVRKYVRNPPPSVLTLLILKSRKTPRAVPEFTQRFLI